MKNVDSLSAGVNPVDSKAYRDAMSHYAGAVQIVTTDGLAGRRGLTITAACSVSDDPPTILVCLQKIHIENELFMKNGVFALSTLAGEHNALADGFSGRTGLSQEERFALGDWHRIETGAPVLKSAIAAFDCRITSVQDHSTHHVVFGEVVGLQRLEDNEALIYLNRRYHTLEL